MHNQDPESKDTQENFIDIDNQGDDQNKNVEQSVVRDECSLQKKSKECTSDNIDIKESEISNEGLNQEKFKEDISDGKIKIT